MKSTRLYFLLFIISGLLFFLSVLLFIPGSAFAQDYQITILVEDVEGRSQELVLGESEEATEGLDTHLGEYQLPPLPPSTAFDARWIVSGYEGFHIDFRPMLADDRTHNIWTMRIQTTGDNLPMTLSWDPSELWDGFFDLYDEPDAGEGIQVDMKEEGSVTISGSSTKQLMVKHRRTRVWNQSIASDWNMISLPVRPDEQAVSEIFPVSEVFLFTRDNGYQSTGDLVFDEGFWIYMENDYNLEVEGEPLMKQIIPVQEGWNLISGFSDVVNFANLETDPVDLGASFFFSYDLGYVIAGEIEPGKGYWYKANEDGEIRIPEGNAAGKTVEGIYEISEEVSHQKTVDNSADAIADSGNKNLSLQIQEELFNVWNSLKFTDAAKRSGVLLFGDEEQMANSQSSEIQPGNASPTNEMHQTKRVTGQQTNEQQQFQYILPPKPPLSAFDVRFSDDRMLAVFPGTDTYVAKRTIALQTDHYPVDVTWDVQWADESLGLLLTGSNGDSEWIAFGETGSVSIEDDIAEIAISTEDHVDTGTRQPTVPVSFRLEQNYPNPFNPGTKIVFTLPEAGQVHLQVFDLLGREITTLVDKPMNQGTHAVHFQAKGLPSGVYLYRLHSGVYVEVRKMILHK